MSITRRLSPTRLTIRFTVLSGLKALWEASYRCRHDCTYLPGAPVRIFTTRIATRRRDTRTSRAASRAAIPMARVARQGSWHRTGLRFIREGRKWRA